MDYSAFISKKSQIGGMSGFKPIWIPDFLMDFQQFLCDWAIRKGKAAIFAECGMGKTPMQLVWAENVYRHTNKPVLITTPLSVAAQTVREGQKFGIEVYKSGDGTFPAGTGIIVTNYERLHKFNPHDFAGVVCDESGILKNFDGATRDSIVEFMRTREYRLLCTATAAPNDYVELGNSAEALGEMGFQDMLTRFFKKEQTGGFQGWARPKYRMRAHAVKDFWRWVCSWARAIRKPSDLGFSDEKMILPPLYVEEHTVQAQRKADGMLFDMPARSLEAQREEKRRTIQERCELAAKLADTGKPAIAWCDLNDEGDLLEKLIPGAKQVSGSTDEDEREEILTAFSSGQLRAIVGKPRMIGFGMNWQHCSHQTFFPSHSFEQYYQAVRRCWRYGQKNPVTIDVISTEGSAGIRGNLQRKSDAADAMFVNLIELMNDQLKINRSSPFHQQTKEISWLAKTR
jgi:hypothetical protein